MKIAILGWGSLVWDPRKLPLASGWEPGGPVLHIEFTRVSRDGRLTLVIDEEHGTPVPTRFALSAAADIVTAREDLRLREECDPIGIASIDIGNGGRTFVRSEAVAKAVSDWAKHNGMDGVVWTGLRPKFLKPLGKPYSTEAALAHLDGLSDAAKSEAIKYIRRAPKEVETPFRRAFEERYGVPQEPKA